MLAVMSLDVWGSAQVLAKSAMLSYERFRIVRDVVNQTWHGAKYWDAWEFDDVCITKDGAHAHAACYPPSLVVLHAKP